MSYSKFTADNQILIETTKNEKSGTKIAIPDDIAYLKFLESTLDEWNSLNDEEDYDKLE